MAPLGLLPIAKKTYAADDHTWNWRDTAPESYNPGNLYWNGNIDANWDGNISGITTLDPSSAPGGPHYHIGNYYNWTAAVAMSNSGAYTSAYSEAVMQSICPAGWTLPTKNSYQNLLSAQGLTAGLNGNIQKSPAYFVYSSSYGDNYGGRYSSYDGNSGLYWTSEVQNIRYRSAARLRFTPNSIINLNSNSDRRLGQSIRCISR